jgi:hypothetical protein
MPFAALCFFPIIRILLGFGDGIYKDSAETAIQKKTTNSNQAQDPLFFSMRCPFVKLASMIKTKTNTAWLANRRLD